jgi:CrcB protein
VPSTDVAAASRTAPRRAHGASGPGAADLAAVALGGGLGSIARYGLSSAFPAGRGIPWAIFAVNVSGCFLLGLLMIYVLEIWPPRRLLRPFLAVGLLGGYTTFSTYAAGVMTLITGHALALAAAYALSSIVAALAAVWTGMKTARVMSAARGQGRRRGSDGRAGGGG